MVTEKPFRVYAAQTYDAKTDSIIYTLAKSFTTQDAATRHIRDRQTASRQRLLLFEVTLKGSSSLYNGRLWSADAFGKYTAASWGKFPINCTIAEELFDRDGRPLKGINLNYIF